MRSLAGLSPRTVGLAAAVVTVVIWTSFIVIARALAQRSLTPFDLAFARIVGASLILVPWGIWLVRSGRLPGWLGLSPLSFRLTALTGLFGGLLYAMLAYAGFFYAPAAHASVLMPGSLPLWTALLAVLLLGERITPTRALGLALIVVGDLLVGGTSLLHALDGSGVWRGDVLFIGASMVWASYSVLVRRWALDAVRTTIAITDCAFVSYVPVYSVLLWLQWVPGQVWVAPWQDVAFQMVFQGVGSVVISGITFTKMIQHFGPVRSTMITALVPGLSALLAVLVLGEPLGWNVLAGLALVTAGIVFGVRKSSVAINSVAASARPAGGKG